MDDQIAIAGAIVAAFGFLIMLYGALTLIVRAIQLFWDWCRR